MNKMLYLIFLMIHIHCQDSVIFKIATNNDRDEVYDSLNIVYQITGDYSLDNLKISTNILDENNKIIYTHLNIIPSDYLFTNKLDITNLKLKENSFYQIEGILKSNNGDIEGTDYYTFKKIEKINRKVKLDEYGRMYVDNELFFPLGIYTLKTTEEHLSYINQTHLNFIMPYDYLVEQSFLNLLQKTQNGKIKILYNVKQVYSWNKPDDGTKGCIDLKEEENYNIILNTIKKFKDNPLFLGWYVNDEYPICRNNYTRNRTLTFHELDPNHPTVTVLDKSEKILPFLNSTDIMGYDVYPVGRSSISEIREVYDKISERYDIIMKAKPMWAVLQVFDWGAYYEKTPHPPTLQEMRSMAWQGLAAGARGILFYDFHHMFSANDVTPFEPRWKDVIEFTDEIWKYKDLFLSIEKVDTIEYIKNNNVVCKQWKVNNSNYIAVINLERDNETFKLNLSDKYEIYKELGNSTYEIKDKEITFNLSPIDVILIKYNSKNNTPDNTSDNTPDNTSDNTPDNGNTKLLIIIISCSVVGAIILVIAIILIRRKCLLKRNDKYDPILNKHY